MCPEQEESQGFQIIYAGFDYGQCIPDKHCCSCAGANASADCTEYMDAWRVPSLWP